MHNENFIYYEIYVYTKSIKKDNYENSKKKYFVLNENCLKYYYGDKSNFIIMNFEN